MDGNTGGTLPGDLREWVEERAEARGVEPVTVLSEAVSTYRLAVTDSGASLDDIDSVSNRLDTVEGRVDGLEGSLDEKIDDVRMRVVQVKRETDENAHRDHGHPELRERLGRVMADVETVRDDLAALDSRVDAGFDNYEEILTYLDGTTTDLDEHLRVVAESLLDLRSRAADIEAAEQEREALRDLMRTANEAGDRKATCDDCGETVHLDLLAEPRCPACRSVFRELSPSKGFFGSATLHTGQPPALEAATPTNDEVASLLEDAASEPESNGRHEDAPRHETATNTEHDDD